MLNKKYQKIDYSDLKGKGKAQESYNFQKASAILADYGFFTNLLKYDWLGADFLAQHLNGDWLTSTTSTPPERPTSRLG